MSARETLAALDEVATHLLANGDHERARAVADAALEFAKIVRLEPHRRGQVKLYYDARRSDGEKPDKIKAAIHARWPDLFGNTIDQITNGHDKSVSDEMKIWRAIIADYENGVFP